MTCEDALLLDGGMHDVGFADPVSPEIPATADSAFLHEPKRGFRRQAGRTTRGPDRTAPKTLRGAGPSRRRSTATVSARDAAAALRDELILGHLWLVRHMLGRLFPSLPAGVDVENLESSGTLGLVQAAEKFDPNRGVKFKTYAYTRIRGAILDELRRNCPLPQHVLEQVAKVRKAYERAQPGTTVEALAADSGLTADAVVDCLAAMRLTRMLSLKPDSEPLWPRADRQEQPHQHLEKVEQKECLVEAIAALSERERLVVTLYYMEDLRLKEIGNVLGLSESRISRVLSGALFQLSEFIRAREA